MAVIVYCCSFCRSHNYILFLVYRDTHHKGSAPASKRPNLRHSLIGLIRSRLNNVARHVICITWVSSHPLVANHRLPPSTDPPVGVSLSHRRVYQSHIFLLADESQTHWRQSHILETATYSLLPATSVVRFLDLGQLQQTLLCGTSRHSQVLTSERYSIAMLQS
jgi:hypothetical protein